MLRIALTFPSDMLSQKFGLENVAALRAMGQVTLNPEPSPMNTNQLLALAGDAHIVVSESRTPAEARLFREAPHLAAWIRRGTDIRNIDLEAASQHGVLVTQGCSYFVPGLVEWILYHMIALSRRFPAYTAAYCQGAILPPELGSNSRNPDRQDGRSGRFRPHRPRAGAGAGGDGGAAAGVRSLSERPARERHPGRLARAIGRSRLCRNAGSIVRGNRGYGRWRVFRCDEARRFSSSTRRAAALWMKRRLRPRWPVDI